MLGKWVFLFILSYFIYRTVINLFNAATGREKGTRHLRNTGVDGGNVRADTGHHKSSNSDRPHQVRKTSDRGPDIEDATWRDL